MAQDRLDEAQGVIARLEARGFLEPDAEMVKAELFVRASARHSGSLAAARAEAEAHPDDLGRRLRLAEALAAEGSFAEALERALSVVEDGPTDLREAARALMISLFTLLGDDHELVTEYRRRLSAALY
jgi:putative thioredoxin